MRRFGSIILALVLLACVVYYPKTTSERVDALPAGAIEFSAPIYSRWWRDVETCAQKNVSMRGVKFYLVSRGNGGFLLPPDSSIEFLGYSYANRPAIVLVTTRVMDSMVVRHEMLHLIASPDHHDPFYFKKLCAGKVSCYINTDCYAQEIR